MANLLVKDGAASSKYIKTDGTGTDVNPHVPHHVVDSGTVTANLSATDNAVLDNIDSNTDYGAVIGGGAEATALRVTIANNSTGVVSVDDNNSSLTVDGTVAVSSGSVNVTNTITEANSAAIKTAVELIDNAISGSEMQVDVVAPLPAGTNAIGKLAANSGVDIGDVDVTSVPAPLNVTGGGTEATAMRVTIASDSTGVVSVDDNSGSLTVDGTVAVSSGSVNITNTITETNSAAIKTAVETIDNAISGNEILIAGGATQAQDVKVTLDGESVTVSSGSVDVTNTITVQDGGDSLTIDNAGLTELASAINASNQMDVNIAAQASDVTIADGGNSITVDGTVIVSSGSIDVIAAGDNAIGRVKITDGVEVANVNASNQLEVEVKNTEVLIAGGATQSNDVKVTLDGEGIVVSSGSVDVVTMPNVAQSTHDNLNANANIQVGDADVANGNPVPISDADSSLTVDGTVAISSGSVNLLANDGVDIGNVDVATVPAPLNVVGSGTEATALRVTIASDSTGVVSVDDNGSSLTVDGTVAVSSGSVAITNTITETNSNAIKTAVELIDNMISGSEAQVDVVTMPSVAQATHDNLNANANIQVGNTDVANGNPVPVSDAGGSLTVDGAVAISSGSVTVTSIAAGSNIVGKVGIDQTTPGTTNKVTSDVITTTPTAYNVTLTSVDTEYSQAMPASCRSFEFQARTDVAIRYAFVTGKVATPTAPYMTLKAGDYYYSPPVNQGAAPSTLYLASSTAGTVVEILAWT